MKFALLSVGTILVMTAGLSNTHKAHGENWDVVTLKQQKMNGRVKSITEYYCDSGKAFPLVQEIYRYNTAGELAYSKQYGYDQPGSGKIDLTDSSESIYYYTAHELTQKTFYYQTASNKYTCTYEHDNAAGEIETKVLRPDGTKTISWIEQTDDNGRLSFVTVFELYAGVNNPSYAYRYDTMGRVSAFYTYDNGILHDIDSQVYNDANRTMLSYAILLDTNGVRKLSCPPWLTQQCKFDDGGHALGRLYHEGNGSKTIVETNRYDLHGNITEQDRKTIFYRDTTDEVWRFSYEYDKYGNYTKRWQAENGKQMELAAEREIEYY